MEVNKAIRRLREENDYTQEYMASQLGISQQAYAKIESGKTRVDMHMGRRISEIFHVPPAALYEWNGVVGHTKNGNHTPDRTMGSEERDHYKMLIQQKDELISFMQKMLNEVSMKLPRQKNKAKRQISEL